MTRSAEETCACMPVIWTVRGNFKINECVLEDAPLTEVSSFKNRYYCALL